MGRSGNQFFVHLLSVMILVSITRVGLAQAGRIYPNVLSHSHNDYQQKHPLADALKYHFDSIEADLWLKHGEIKVSHLGWMFKGTLEDLYLKPLQTLVAKNNGSVYGDGKTLMLWLDIKDSNPALLDRLQVLLEKYAPILRTFKDDREIPGPVVIVLTGHDPAKQLYVKKFAIRYASRDSNFFSESDPDGDSRWGWYALKWQDFFKAIDVDQLTNLVEKIHNKGRKVRFWDAPNRPNYWRAAIAARVDLIGTDTLEPLSTFLSREKLQLLQSPFCDSQTDPLEGEF